jgi:hypothetical protein
MGNHTKEMQRVRVVRLGLKDLPVKRLRFLQATGLVMLDSKLEYVGNRCHALPTPEPLL